MTNGLIGRGKEFERISWDEFFALGQSGQIVNQLEQPQLKRVLGALRRPHESGGATTPAFISGHPVADLADFPDVEIQRLVNDVGPVSVRVLEEALWGLLELGISPRQVNVESLAEGFDETANG